MTPTDDRLIMFPIRDQDIYEMYKKAQKAVWFIEEVDLAEDPRDWERLSDNERHFLKYVLAFFATSDSVVNENLVQNFADEVQVWEARAFYGFQIAIENIHTEMYSQLLMTYVPNRCLAVIDDVTGQGHSLTTAEADRVRLGQTVKYDTRSRRIVGNSSDSSSSSSAQEESKSDDEGDEHLLVQGRVVLERDMLFHSIETIPVVRRKIAWAQRWTDRSRASFAERVIAYACVEGIFFSASFCSIFWMKKRNLMPGLCFSNELISKDEGLHCDFAVLMYSKLVAKLPVERVHEIVRSAVDIECEFVTDAIPVELIGMNSGLMRQYVRFVTDRLLVALDVPPLYGDTNPFDWMELISVPRKTNFFERKVSEYQKANVGGSSEGAESHHTFALDADF